MDINNNEFAIKFRHYFTLRREAVRSRFTWSVSKKILLLILMMTWMCNGGGNGGGDVKQVNHSSIQDNSLSNCAYEHRKFFFLEVSMVVGRKKDMIKSRNNNTIGLGKNSKSKARSGEPEIIGKEIVIKFV